MSSDRRLVTSSFLTALFRRAPPRSFVEVRARTDEGMRRFFRPAGRLDLATETIMAVASKADVFVGVIPRRRRGGGRSDLVETADVVWVDCDTSDAVAALRAFRPAPGMVVGSGSQHNCHAYWFLRESVPLDVIERVNRRLALKLGADAQCSDAARVLRAAGSFNKKHSPPVAVRLLSCRPDPGSWLADIERRLPPESPRTLVRDVGGVRLRTGDSLDAIAPRVYFERLTALAVGRSGKVTCPFHPVSVCETTASDVLPARSLADVSSNDRVSPDPLLLVPPPVYFERLTGLRVGRSGKLRCLFHDDRHPSLHVYPEAGRGWYCFGCGLGGSVYDLAALLSGRTTRGADFLELRRELEKLLLMLPPS